MMDWEINLGGIKIKSGFIVVFLAFASAVAGGVWTAGELYNRLVVVEDGLADIEIPDLAPIDERVSVLEEKLNAASERIVFLEAMRMDIRMQAIETKIEDQNLGQLQGNLAQLQTNLENIMAGQEKLQGFSESVEESARMVDKLRQDIATFEQDMNDVWTALDEVSY